MIESNRLASQGGHSQPRAEQQQASVFAEGAPGTQASRGTEVSQLSASTTKHTSKAVKLSDSRTTSICKYTEKDQQQLQSSIKRHSETPARVKIIRFHNNLKKGGLFEQKVDLEDRATFFNPQYVAEHASHIYKDCLA